MQKHPVVTLGSIIHAQFVQVDVAAHGKDGKEEHVLLRLKALNDPDVEDLTLCISGKRAQEAGLVIH
jgi:hypothetical protein